MEKVLAIEGVHSIHDFHCWSLIEGRNIISFHLLYKGNGKQVLHQATIEC